MRIPLELRDEIVAHALRDAPNECCGMIAVRDGVAEAVYPVENVEASPLRFEMDGDGQYRAWSEIDRSGADVAIYHSHTRSPAFPSPTDINMAKLWPGAEWLIVGTEGDEPQVRSFLIDPEHGKVAEVPPT